MQFQLSSMVSNIISLSKRPDKIFLLLVISTIMKLVEPDLFNQGFELISGSSFSPKVLLVLKLACILAAIYGFIGSILFLLFSVLYSLKHGLEKYFGCSKYLTVPNWYNGTFRILSTGFIWMWILAGFIWLFWGYNEIPAIIINYSFPTNFLAKAGFIISAPFASLTLPLFLWTFLYELASFGGAKSDPVKIMIIEPIIINKIREPVNIKVKDSNQSL